MKQKIKKFLSDILYLLYDKRLFKNKLQVHTVEETIEELINSNKSMIRFGDGEISVIRGRNTATQKGNIELQELLKDIIKYEEENLIITIPGIFQGLGEHHVKSSSFWKEHLLIYRKYYNKYCNTDKIYYNTFFSRGYYYLKDKDGCEKRFESIKKIWEDKDVIVVEGLSTHNGVGNDLLSGVRSLKRIIGPAVNAFDRYEEILKECMKQPTEALLLLSIGAAAKPVAHELFQRGYRVLDIGNLDLEYEWFLQKAEGKMPLEKHRVLGERSNLAAGYTEYWEQIVAVL